MQQHNEACVEEGWGYLARDQFPQRIKAKKGKTEKSPSKASRVVDWAGEEKGLGEPGDMPLMPPFQTPDSDISHALIGQVSQCPLSDSTLSPPQITARFASLANFISLSPNFFFSSFPPSSEPGQRVPGAWYWLSVFNPYCDQPQ